MERASTTTRRRARTVVRLQWRGKNDPHHGAVDDERAGGARFAFVPARAACTARPPTATRDTGIPSVGGRLAPRIAGREHVLAHVNGDLAQRVRRAVDVDHMLGPANARRGGVEGRIDPISDLLASSTSHLAGPCAYVCRARPPERTPESVDGSGNRSPGLRIRAPARDRRGTCLSSERRAKQCRADDQRKLDAHRLGVGESGRRMSFGMRGASRQSPR